MFNFAQHEPIFEKTFDYASIYREIEEYSHEWLTLVREYNYILEIGDFEEEDDNGEMLDHPLEEIIEFLDSILSDIKNIEFKIENLLAEIDQE